MARLSDLPQPQRDHLAGLPCPTFDATPWQTPPTLSECAVAVISTAGLHHRDDHPFTFDPGDYYRVISSSVPAADLLMSHVSANFDRSGFQQDWNVVFPLDRLRDLAREGYIGAAATYHYSFMGAVDPVPLEPTARQLSGVLKADGVDVLLLVPV